MVVLSFKRERARQTHMYYYDVIMIIVESNTPLVGQLYYLFKSILASEFDGAFEKLTLLNPVDNKLKLI